MTNQGAILAAVNWERRPLFSTDYNRPPTSVFHQDATDLLCILYL